MKRLCGVAVCHTLRIITPHLSTTYVHAAYYSIVTDRVAWSVGLSVAVSL